MTPLLTRLRSMAGANSGHFECCLSVAEVREIVKALEGWIAIKSVDDLPKKVTPCYEQYDCLIWHNGSVRHRVWNCEHVCWDDRTGDDFYCDALEPSHYILFPEPPAAPPLSSPAEVASFIDSMGTKRIEGGTDV